MGFDNRDPALKAKQLAGRLAKNGGQYASAETRALISSTLRASKIARTHCKRGHAFATHATLYRGVRICKACRSIRKKLAGKYAGIGLAPTGGSRMSAIATAIWAGRYARYGPTGLSDAGRHALSQHTKQRLARDGHPMAKKTHCKHGHAFTPKNTRVSRGARICLACVKLRRRCRPYWVTHDGVRVNVRVHDAFYWRELDRLKARVVCSHPDRRSATGRGTAKQFIAAMRALDAFRARESKWYAAVGLFPPRHRRAAPRLRISA